MIKEIFWKCTGETNEIGFQPKWRLNRPSFLEHVSWLWNLSVLQKYTVFSLADVTLCWKVYTEQKLTFLRSTHFWTFIFQHRTLSRAPIHESKQVPTHYKCQWNEVKVCLLRECSLDLGYLLHIFSTFLRLLLSYVSAFQSSF